MGAVFIVLNNVIFRIFGDNKMIRFKAHSPACDCDWNHFTNLMHQSCVFVYVAALERRLGPGRRALVPPFHLGRLGNMMFMYAGLVGLARSPELSPYSPIILLPEPSDFSVAFAPHLDALTVCACGYGLRWSTNSVFKSDCNCSILIVLFAFNTTE